MFIQALSLTVYIPTLRVAMYGWEVSRLEGKRSENTKQLEQELAKTTAKVNKLKEDAAKAHEQSRKLKQKLTTATREAWRLDVEYNEGLEQMHALKQKLDEAGSAYGSSFSHGPHSS